jgi:hypothetical protein
MTFGKDKLSSYWNLWRDILSDVLGVTTGAAVALIPTCLESIVGYFGTPAVPLTILHFAEICLFFLCAGNAGTAYKINRTRKEQGDELAKIIRGQDLEWIASPLWFLAEDVVAQPLSRSSSRPV